MRIKIIAKTPDPKDLPASSLRLPPIYTGKIAKVVNLDTGEEIEGITKLELVLSPDQIVHARVEIEVAGLDIDIEPEVV
jgi:hypothetical protein